ncbi:MFS transporter, partial [Paenarthrobacter nicotinovorans]|uniref:MFS transporter n=1 Tax=Paenarthrobacter nicotinovorans TaxID=29320 RepID=UPI0024850419
MTTTQADKNFSLRSIALPAFGPALLFCIGEGAVLPVIALSARELGASVAVSALIVTLIGLGSWIFNIPASIITEKFGERWSIVGAGALGAMALGAAAFAPQVEHGLWLLAASVTLVGMSASVFNLARQKYLTEAVPVIFRARALSTLGGVTRIGIFIGPFIGAGVMQFAGISGAYWVGFAGMMAAAALSLTIPDLVAPDTSDGGPR